jgi:peptidoglycan/LPS O-acetylase OafA/YrhL
MMAACLVAAYIFLLPSELESFAKSLLSASLSVSNFYFWLHSGYFDAPSAEQPLLHTWSLAVEEQFYIFFPLFLVFVRRFYPGRFKPAVVALACVSFLLSAIGVYKFQSMTFYLPVTRAWELLLGTMLSLQLFPALRSPLWRNLASAAGLVLILLAIFRFDVVTPFPGPAALLPCCGAALIIAAGEHGTSLVGRLLGCRPMAFIGLISYSLYLWHWPLIVFQKMSMIQVPGAPGRNVKAALFLASLLLATLSWKYIETPFRKGQLYLSGRSAFVFAGASTLLLIIGAGCILSFHGFPARYSPEEIKIASYTADQNQYKLGTCFLASGNTARDFDKADCMRMDSAKSNYLILGDSHAAQLAYGLVTVFPEINFLEAASSGCEPTLGVRTFDVERCVATMRYVFNDFLPSHHLDGVLLAARWEPGDLDRLGDTIRTLKSRGVPVILIGPIVQYDSALPRLLAVSIRTKDSALAYRHELTSYRRLDKTMASLASQDWKVPYVSYFQLLCPKGHCIQYAAHDLPLQFDYGHLTTQGSVLFAQTLKNTNTLTCNSKNNLPAP